MIKELPPHQGGPALGTNRLVPQPVPGYPILGAAPGTWQYDAVLIHLLLLCRKANNRFMKKLSLRASAKQSHSIEHGL
jgi:hypothetical protein